MFDLGIKVGRCRLVAHLDGGYAVPGAKRPVSRAEAFALAKRIDDALSASGRSRSPLGASSDDGPCARCGAINPSEVETKCLVSSFADQSRCRVWDFDQ